eukprot:41175-Rhodomonas_salina.1
MEMRTCVEEGPGKHCPSAKSSMKTEEDSHLSCEQKTVWNIPMCAAGPPKAVQPSGANCRMISPKLASTHPSSCFVSGFMTARISPPPPLGLKG